MKIELHRITIWELVDGYVDDAEAGVRGYGGRLDIRPPYQREFVYGEKERNAVISTVMKGFPLNVMYWARNLDGTFEVMDGQQRTISLCRYANGDFSWGELDMGAKFFHRQPEDVQRKFLDYELMVYFCEGEPSEKIDWFKIYDPSRRRRGDGTLAPLPEGDQLGGDVVPEVPERDKRIGVGAPLQGVRREVLQPA